MSASSDSGAAHSLCDVRHSGRRVFGQHLGHKRLGAGAIPLAQQHLRLQGLDPAVNFPAVAMARESAYRVAIANANVPNMLGQISTAMAHAGLNIHNMVNKSRGEMAYTLVDVDSAVPPEATARLRAIDGVLSVRYLPRQG